MEKKSGNKYKRLAHILGLIGGCGGIIVAYLNTTLFISPVNFTSPKFISFIQILLLCWLCTFIICLLLYAIGDIIEILQAINKNISTLSTDKLAEDEVNIWKRPT